MRKLKIIHLNCRSILSQYDVFRDFVCGAEYDIVALTETWLRPDVTDSVVEIPGFSFIRHDRPTHGGGVAMYIRESIQFQVIDSTILDYLEQLWITLVIDCVSVAIGVVYRPCGSDLSSFLDFFQNIFLKYF